ncbi:MAG TPA: hypothetical protein PKD00_00720 [Burkholderiales bacterium]|nr:hypothetical protein [Burkholderiales bacterium]
MLKLTAVEFNHKFIDRFLELLTEGYVDSPKTAEKHPLAGQRTETIMDVMKREFREYLENPNDVAQVSTLDQHIKLLVDNRGDILRMNEDGTQSEDKPLYKKKTKSLDVKGTVKANPNAVFIGSLFAKQETPVQEEPVQEEIEFVTEDQKF